MEPRRKLIFYLRPVERRVMWGLMALLAALLSLLVWQKWQASHMPPLITPPAPPLP